MKTIEITQEQNKDNKDNLECIICLENIDNNYKITKECSCIVPIHENCFNEWIYKNPNNCPICREKIIKESNNLTNVNTSAIILNPINQLLFHPLNGEEYVIFVRDEITQTNINNSNRFRGESPTRKQKILSFILSLFICVAIIIIFKILA